MSNLLQRKDMTTRLTLPRVVDRFSEYEKSNPDWGPMHVVLSDGNVDDDSVKWCMEQARRDGDEEAIVLCDLLLQLTKTQRRKLPNLVRGN